MNGEQKWKVIGSEIRDAVEDALKTGDFSGLDTVLSDTVTETINTVKDQFVSNTQNSSAEQEQHSVVKNMPVPYKKIGSVSGTLFQIFGGIGTGVTAVFLVVFLVLASVFGGRFWGALIFMALLLGGSVFMLNLGSGQKKRLRRAEKYKALAGNRHYIDLKDLALHTGKSVKYILKDIKKILDAGIFPEGHLDRQESCLMLDDKIYREYLSIEKQRMEQEKNLPVEREETVEKQGKTSAESGDISGQNDKGDSIKNIVSGNAELNTMIAEGQEYIRKLRKMNDNIPGEVISEKLFRLERLLKEIFDALESHPEQMPQMRKFMSYYLPTTVKLVGAYEEFDALSVQGEDIREAKEEIEKTLDTINEAFGELLNRLFRAKAYDVTADAQVLQTMLAKEGLSGSPAFEKEKENGGNLNE